jgi:UDP-N-acetyl-D-mannosaminuronic acid dehydrogenase
VPLFLIRGLERRIGPLEGRRVCVLGLAFKADTDDERDSLSHKLVRLLERQLAEVVVHDPLVAAATVSFEDAIRGAEVVVVATNHSVFRTAAALATIVAHASSDCLIADPWDCWGSGQLFAYAGELAPSELAR